MRAIMDQTGYLPAITVTGSKGTIKISDGKIIRHTNEAYAAGQDPQTIEPEPPELDTMASFARAMQTRENALTWSGDNIESLRMMFAAIESVETGKMVSLRGE